MAAVRRMLQAFEARHAIPLAILWAFTGCYMSYRDFSDGEMPDVYVPEDGGPDDGPAEVDEASDGDAGFDAVECTGAWLDPTTGYLWENQPSDTFRNWDAAVSYCDGLTACGYPAGAWHLPTISELRSFIRGCPGTMTGGACGVTDACLDSECDSSSCYYCSYLGGPGTDGCYWEPGVSGGCYGYWSSSSYAGGASDAWSAFFYSGYVHNLDETYALYARCVRRGP